MIKIKTNKQLLVMLMLLVIPTTLIVTTTITAQQAVAKSGSSRGQTHASRDAQGWTLTGLVCMSIGNAKNVITCLGHQKN